MRTRIPIFHALVTAALFAAGCSTPCLPLLSGDVLPQDAERTLLDAETSLRTGDAARALVLFEHVVADHPDHFRALRGEQDSLLALGRDADARAIADQREAAEHDVTAALLLARVAADDAAADAAIDLAITRDPKNANVRLALGVRHARDGDYLAAESDFDEALKVCTPPPDASLARARVRALEGRFRDAASDYLVYIDRAPGDLVAMHELASLFHRELGDVDAAERIYDRMLQFDPKSPEAIVGTAVIATSRRDWAGAERLYLSVGDVEPVALVNLGLLYRDQLGRPADALDCFQRFIAFRGPRASNRSLGDLLFVVPGYVEELKASLQANPQDAARATAGERK